MFLAPPSVVIQPDPPAPAAEAPAPPVGPSLRVLLVDDGAHRVQAIRDELTRLGCFVVGVLDSATHIHDCVLQLAPDVVIVDSESPSRDALENLAAIHSHSPRPVVVFAEDASDDPMRRALQAGVSAYVVAGLQPQRLAPVLQVAIARFEQDKLLRSQLAEAQTQLVDRRVIERAKGLLMQEFGLDEEQAFRHLRKLAMDRGRRIADVAERVVEARSLLKPPG